MSQFSIDIFTNVINTSLAEPYGSLLNGITFGKDVPSYTNLYLKFKRSGLLHIMVLSGSNIAMLGAMIGAFFGFVHKKIAVILTICFIAGFTISVGFEPPVVRAAIMGTISLLAIVFNRKATAIYSLVLTGIISLVFWPEWMTSVSFLLSYGATLGIILFGSSQSKPRWWLPNELRISLAAQLLTTPIIFIYFKQISIISPLTNVLVSFIVGPLMLLGFCISLLGLIHPVLTIPFAFIAVGMLKYLLFVVNLSELLPYSFLSF
mgnify:CR=1 FL=1